MHPNSLKAYHEGLPRLKGRARMIFEALQIAGEPKTDRQIMEYLGFSEPNSVRPRVTELIATDYLREVDNVRCPVTGKTVRRVEIVK